MNSPVATVDLRCFCSRSPLLAKAGRGSDGQPFLHIKVYKSNRLYAEVVAGPGTVRIRCRECLRWHVVTVKTTDYHIKPDELPDSIPVREAG